MFGWFKPKCPVSTREKAWIEYRFGWLLDSLGTTRIRRALTVLPTAEFLPFAPEMTQEFAQRVMERLGKFMGVDCANLKLNVVPDEILPDAAGDYTPGRIRISHSQLAAPPRLAKTLAHELGHEILLGGEYVTPDTPDHEPLTDLVCVYLGLGILAANATVSESHYNSPGRYGWSYQRIGYLSSRELGYALALYAWFRGDDIEPWTPHLRLDARVALEQGLKYLEKTSDCWFQNSLAPDFAETNTAVLVDSLHHASPSRRMISLWQIESLPPEKVHRVGADVIELLADRDEDVRAAAATTLGIIHYQNAKSRTLLTDRLQDTAPVVRAAACFAVGQLHIDSPETVQELTSLLKDAERDVVGAATQALALLGTAAASAVRALLGVLSMSLADCNSKLTTLAIRALRSCCDDPEMEIQDYFAGLEDDFLPMALEAFAASDSSDDTANEDDWDNKLPRDEV